MRRAEAADVGDAQHPPGSHVTCAGAAGAIWSLVHSCLAFPFRVSRFCRRRFGLQGLRDPAGEGRGTVGRGAGESLAGQATQPVQPPSDVPPALCPQGDTFASSASTFGLYSQVTGVFCCVHSAAHHAKGFGAAPPSMPAPCPCARPGQALDRLCACELTHYCPAPISLCRICKI